MINRCKVHMPYKKRVFAVIQFHDSQITRVDSSSINTRFNFSNIPTFLIAWKKKQTVKNSKFFSRENFFFLSHKKLPHLSMMISKDFFFFFVFLISLYQSGEDLHLKSFEDDERTTRNWFWMWNWIPLPPKIHKTTFQRHLNVNCTTWTLNIYTRHRFLTLIARDVNVKHTSFQRHLWW